MAADGPSDAGVAGPRIPRNPLSRRQIETVVSRSAAIFGLVFGAQTFPVMLEQADRLTPGWFIVVGVAVYGGLLAAVIASILKRGVRAVNSYVAVAWFTAMATWPFGIADPGLATDGRPWPWFILTVATAAAAVAWPVWAATAALVVAPLTYGIVRMLPAGGGESVEDAALDVVYAVILGGAVLIIITLLRHAAATVDLAQSMALDRYSNAVGQHATEVERVQVDAIVHDSVLTTLISAARAFTPEAEALAARMAANAMGYLRDAASSSPDEHALVILTELAERIRAATNNLAARFEVRTGDLAGQDIPNGTAEAVYSAAVQSMVNSTQHAGADAAVTRWLAIRSAAGGGIVVEVGDTGAGFDVQSVPTARMGLRVSIVERVANAGGQVDIDSSPGEGTVVTITWPAPRMTDAGALGASGGALPEMASSSEEPTP